jgi:hypothetical protein
MNWSELPLIERAVAIHEGAHAVLAELIQWPVKAVNLWQGGHAGDCRYLIEAPNPWVDLIISSAGHSAERHFFGCVVDAPSGSDRHEAAKDFASAGLEEWATPWAVRQLERDLWPVFIITPIRLAVREVAITLVERRHIDREEFLSAARPALRSDRLARRTRRFCRRLAVDVLAQHLEGEE